jgi:transposase
VTLIYRRCAGMDVHQKLIWVCARIRTAKNTFTTETAVFGTFTQDLEKMARWLRERKIQHVAMESTGVYWKPVWNVLEASKRGFALVLVNPQHIKALPGRKTDQQDAERIATYLQQGLLRGSFVPPQPVRELRELTRRRTHLQGDRNRVINRIGRLLETANIKLGSVLSNIVGQSGRAILNAIVAGETAAGDLATYTSSRVKHSREEFELALEGRYSDHLRWLLGQLLEELDQLDRRVALVDLRIGQLTKPHMDLIARLCTLPGVDIITAHIILAEIGTDMSQFPDARHLASWAGLCPGNSESAGKRFSGRTRKGDRYLRRVLVQNAWAVAHMKDCALTALFHRIAARAGMKKAAVAVAHRILMLAYYIIRDGSVYREAGGDVYDRRNPERTAKRLARRLQRIGYAVTLNPVARTTRSSNAPPLPGQICAKCNAWGIACIHVRPKASSKGKKSSR